MAYKCKLCSYTSSSQTAMRLHVESRHRHEAMRRAEESTGLDSLFFQSAFSSDSSSNDYGSCTGSDSYSGGGGDFGGGGASDSY